MSLTAPMASTNTTIHFHVSLNSVWTDILISSAAAIMSITYRTAESDQQTVANSQRPDIIRILFAKKDFPGLVRDPFTCRHRIGV